MSSVPSIDVLARWAYSEINDSVASRFYDNRPGIGPLRATLAAGIKFEELCIDECRTLASLCTQGSPALTKGYLGGIDSFAVVRVNHKILGKLMLAPNVW